MSHVLLWMGYFGHKFIHPLTSIQSTPGVILIKTAPKPYLFHC